MERVVKKKAGKNDESYIRAEKLIEDKISGQSDLTIIVGSYITVVAVRLLHCYASKKGKTRYGNCIYNHKLVSILSRCTF